MRLSNPGSTCTASLVDLGASRTGRPRQMATSRAIFCKLLSFHIDHLGVQVLLHAIDIELLLATTNKLHVRYVRVLVTFEDGIDFFQCLALGLDPVHSLALVSVMASRKLREYIQLERRQ